MEWQTSTQTPTSFYCAISCGHFPAYATSRQPFMRPSKRARADDCHNHASHAIDDVRASYLSTRSAHPPWKGLASAGWSGRTRPPPKSAVSYPVPLFALIIIATLSLMSGMENCHPECANHRVHARCRFRTNHCKVISEALSVLAKFLTWPAKADLRREISRPPYSEPFPQAHNAPR